MVHISVPIIVFVMQALTDAQRGVLTFLVRYRQRHDRAPTLTEIRADRGFASTRGVRKHLEVLARKNFIELGDGIRRGIRLMDAAYQVLPAETDQALPLVGRVAAGKPILSAEHIEALIRVDGRVFRPRANLLLQVQGESMIDAGILDRDLVGIHLQPEARSGQIVLARVVDETTGDAGLTIKKLRTRGSKISLESANNSPEYPPIIGTLGETVFIEGLFCGLIRSRPVALQSAPSIGGHAK